jgi:hypothetical protein
LCRYGNMASKVKWHNHFIRIVKAGSLTYK